MVTEETFSHTSGGSGGRSLEDQSVDTIQRCLAGKPRTTAMWELLTSDTVAKTLWEMADYVATTKLLMNDHGRTHAMVATASALTLLDLATSAGVAPDFVKSGFGDNDDASLIVLTSTLCHDWGNIVHRHGHAELAVSLVIPVLDRLLPAIYEDPAKLTRVKTFILSAIHTHHGDPRPLTIEAATVCIGDASDMTKGRGRAAFERGSVTIHSVSALAIERVDIRRGATKPIELRITMTNSAGIYQVQDLLAPKVRAGPLAGYVDVVAITDVADGDHEQRIVSGIRMDGSKFVPCRNGGTGE